MNELHQSIDSSKQLNPMPQAKSINIFNETDSNIAVTQQSGQLVFNKIDKILSLGLKVKIDFTNIEVITPAFLNAAIGQLYSKYASNELQEKIELQNVLPEDVGFFQKVINNAKVYFAFNPLKN
ncbi:MAG: STAS-like domain-containing protein [Bacteroidales bacterium]|nr:STAS-like domain-containing protein [Bacteroidales bacterium]